MARKEKRTSKTIKGFAATRKRRGIIDQAASDVERGLEDTDCRGTKAAKPHCPPAPKIKKKR